MISILALLLQATAAPAAAPAPAPAPWTVTPRPNPDPAITSTLVGTPATDGSGVLRVRCDVSPKGKFVSVQFFSKTALGDPLARPVTLTIDNGTPLGANWDFQAKAAYIQDDVAVTTLTTAIAGGKVIKLQTTVLPTNQPVLATFAGPPSAEPVKQLLAACGYTLGVPPVREPEPKSKK